MHLKTPMQTLILTRLFFSILAEVCLKMEQFPRQFPILHKLSLSEFTFQTLGISKANDIHFVESILDNLEKVQKIKSNDYFAVGFSNGGGILCK